MSNKTALRELIDLIKHKTGMTQAEIAEIAGYKRTYLSEALSKDEPPAKMISKLKLTFSDILENRQKQTDSVVGDFQPHYGHKSDYRDDFIIFLKREISRLERLLDISLEQIRENLIVIRSLQDVSQDLLTELLAKKRNAPVAKVAEEISRANSERYKKLKAESNLFYEDK